MADNKLTFRQTLLQILAVLYDLSFKQIGARCGMTERNVSHHLRRPRRRDDIKDDVFERLLSAIPCSPAAVSAVADCIETVAALSASGCYALGRSLLLPPAIGTFGTMGRNIWRDAGFRQWDMSLFKNFVFKEKLTAQLRIEAFNILNTHSRPVSMILDFLYRATEPALRPIRQFVPSLGGLDITPIILLLIIWFVEMELRQLEFYFFTR